jgi:hypothetical protein
MFICNFSDVAHNDETLALLVSAIFIVIGDTLSGKWDVLGYMAPRNKKIILALRSRVVNYDILIFNTKSFKLPTELRVFILLVTTIVQLF